MKCSNCGAEIKDGAAFCPKCGAKQSAQTPQEKKSKPSGGIIVGIGIASAVVVAVIAAAVVFLSKGGTLLPAGGETGVSGSKEADETVDETPLYTIEDVPVIDFSARNYTPGTKEPGMKWDSELFYWLEDADTMTDEDGNIANCNVSKTLLRDAQTGELCQYEIYSDPDDGNVYKIVSINGYGAALELVDYYYKDGQPNFMFRREDTVYTPTYATIGKVGERYYFDGDVMVRWRMIRVPGEIGEYTLSKGDAWYSQADYFAESDEIREIYDETEWKVLNMAHNVYDAVTGNANIGVVQGRLRDTAGNGVAEKKIKLYRAEDNALLYEAETDEGGNFSLFVYLDGSVCNLQMGADEQYRELKLQGVELGSSSAIYAYDLTAHKESGDKYPVTIRLYSVADMVSDEDGKMNADTLRQATAVVREGGRNYGGEVLETAEAPNGEIALNLLSGIYTVQLQAEGYLDTYLEVEVMEGETSKDAYLMTTLAESQTGVILTWEGDGSDLDLTLFTPYQGADGDMAHIGGAVKEDGHGNFLIADNGSRCEAMYLNTGEKGGYKLYVNNYTDSVAGNYSSVGLSASNVHVYIYNSNGFVADYAFASGQNGVVWEVAEISGAAITPAQRVYSEIGGKSWWMEEKGKKRLVKEIYMYSGRGSSMSRTDYEYDDRGKLAREIFSYYGSEWGGEEFDRLWKEGFLEGGHLERSVEYSYQYDGSGNLIKESKEYFYPNDSRIGRYAEYAYDAQGRKIREIGYGEGMGYHDWDYEYWYEALFDSRGNLIKEIFYDDYEMETLRAEAESGGGNLIERDLSGVIWGQYEYSYDSQGNLTKASQYSHGTIDCWCDYGYDSRGNLIEEDWKDSHGNGYGGVYYTYDDRGNLTRREDTWGSYYECEYNAQGEKVRELSEGEDPHSYTKWEAFYDGQGNLIKLIDYDDYASWTEYFYDDQGNRIKELHYDGTYEYIVSSTEYFYDDQGNRTKEIHYEGTDAHIVSWTEYFYDDQGNRTKEIHYDGTNEYDTIISWQRYYIYE